MTPQPTHIVDLAHCPRCLGNHAGLTVTKFRNSVEGRWTHWATCPATGEPIVHRFTTSDGTTTYGTAFLCGV